MSFSSRYNSYLSNKSSVRSSTRAALNSLNEAVMWLDEPSPPTPHLEDYIREMRRGSGGGGRTGRNRGHVGPTPEQQAEEELRREYRARFGGDYTLREYQDIAREDARFSKYRRNEPMRVTHRRGDFDVVTERRPQETSLGRVENQYWVAMGQEDGARRIQEDPYRYDAEAYADSKKGKRTRTYTEQEFEDGFRALRVADDYRPAEQYGDRHRDQRGVDCFRIPASNRDENQYKVKGFVKHPKLTYEEPRETNARPRGTYKGKEIRKVPMAEMPAANQYYDFF